LMHHSYPLGCPVSIVVFLELPLDIHVRIELRDVITARRQRLAYRTIKETILRRIVMIVFDYNRIGLPVRLHTGRRIPAEEESIKEIPRRVEMK